VMIRSLLIVGIFVVLSGACGPSPPRTVLPGATAAVPLTGLPNRMQRATSGPIPRPLGSSTFTPTATLACETHSASVGLSAPVRSLHVGDRVRVTVTLTNEGCVALGSLQYRLHIQSDRTVPILSPSDPLPVVHYTAVGQAESDTAEFDFVAAAPGQATLTASANFEVHLGYPGPAYWGASASREPLILTVRP